MDQTSSASDDRLAAAIQARSADEISFATLLVGDESRAVNLLNRFYPLPATEAASKQEAKHVQGDRMAIYSIPVEAVVRHGIRLDLGEPADAGLKDVIQTAKRWVTDAFAEEGVTNVGLEEILKDREQGDWLITIGFTRSWDSEFGALHQLGARALKRGYKVVRIDAGSGQVVALTSRENA